MFTLCVHGDDASENFQQAFTRLAIPGQRRPRGIHATLPGSTGLIQQLSLDPHWPEQGTAGGGADDAKADFGAARHGLVKHGQRMADGRQRDNRHGVPGQYK
ncbi:hypothetical protein D3C87_1490730 [compost metagenome]